jgi:hypothetical protein
MNIMRLFLFGLFAMSLAGCTTGYQSAGLSGGFSHTQLQPDMFQVRFKGNGYTGSERSSDFCLLRCADLTIEYGYSYFAIIDSENRTQTSVVSNNTSTTTGTLQTFGNTTYGNFNTSGGGSQTIHKPRSLNTIKLYKEKPENRNVFDAAFLQNSIRKKYNDTFDPSYIHPAIRKKFKNSYK